MSRFAPPWSPPGRGPGSPPTRIARAWLFRLLFDDDGLRATWFKVITESEAGWARVIALRLGIDPNSQRAALIGAVVVAAARLSTKSFVDSGTDVDPARIFAANLELLGDELFAGPSPTTIKKAGTRS